MRTAVIVSLLASVVPAQAFAWGQTGHSIVAELAQRRLSPAATAKLQELIGGASLASVSSWADDYKFSAIGGGTYGWHFTNIDIAGDGTWDKQCGLEGDCLPEALEREIAVLSDKHSSFLMRQNALRLVVHLIGDLSQPFHCASHRDDQGGNKVKVAFEGQRPDKKPIVYGAGDKEGLHLLWDDVLLDSYQFSWGSLAEEIETIWVSSTPPENLDGPYVDSWMRACHEAGKQAYAMLPAGWEAAAAAGQPVKLGLDYQKAARPFASRLLAAGAVRLSAVLERELTR